MPTATVDLDHPPQDVLEALDVLKHGLDEAIPARRAHNLLVGTWNIRAFGGATPRFEPGPKDNPKRNYADICALAEVVRRFDVVAIQETREDLTALKAMMQRLGDHWTFVITDVGLGDAANGERLAYVYDRGRVKTSGLAGELVVPPKGIGEGDQTLVDQFARSPFAVSFSTGDDGLTLVTTHIVYGHQAKDRTKEIHAVGEWLKDRASSGRDFDTNMIALGDFNIDKLGDENFQSLTATGISIPDQLQTRSSTIFDHGTKTHFYDQIAWFDSDGPEKLAFDCTDAGWFDWTKYILTDLDSIPKSWRISDHFPLWCEFTLPGGSDLPGRRGQRGRRFR